jgi:SAM-dependent methyltransferase
MVVRYDLSPVAWRDYPSFLQRLIEAEGARRICELGGGANPALPLDYVREHDLDYVVVDVSESELAKAPTGYTTLSADASATDFALADEFDLVLSIMVLEHLPNPELFHRNVHKLLRRGGTAFHFFPTWYAAPFVANRFLPESLSRAALRRVQVGRDDSGKHGKFKAYYRWCRGPTARQIKRFEQVGFRVEEFIGFFGHGYYGGIRGLRALDGRLGPTLVRYPLPFLTSFAFVVLRKP